MCTYYLTRHNLNLPLYCSFLYPATLHRWHFLSLTQTKVVSPHFVLSLNNPPDFTPSNTQNPPLLLHGTDSLFLLDCLVFLRGSDFQCCAQFSGMTQGQVLPFARSIHKQQQSCLPATQTTPLPSRSHSTCDRPLGRPSQSPRPVRTMASVVRLGVDAIDLPHHMDRFARRVCRTKW